MSHIFDRLRTFIMLWETDRAGFERLDYLDVSEKPIGWIPESPDEEYEFVTDGRVYQRFRYVRRDPHRYTRAMVNNMQFTVVILTLSAILILQGAQSTPIEPVMRNLFLLLYLFCVAALGVIGSVYIYAEVYYIQQPRGEEAKVIRHDRCPTT